MAAGYNRVVLVGNLTRDPELRQLQSGASVCKLGLAVNRQFKNRQSGSMVQDVCFVDVEVWGPQAESCNQYLQKGRSILVDGRLKFDSWKDGEGQTRSKHCVVAENIQFLGSGQDFAQDDAPAQKPAQAKAPRRASAPVNNQTLDEPPFEDDLPF